VNLLKISGNNSELLSVAKSTIKNRHLSKKVFMKKDQLKFLYKLTMKRGEMQEEYLVEEPDPEPSKSKDF
jgi:hypothetical protein